MRKLVWLTLSLTGPLLLSTDPGAQTGAGPSLPVPRPPSACYQLRLVEIPGADHHWARLQTGDEWITGCVGSPGKCVAPVWVPC